MKRTTKYLFYLIIIMTCAAAISCTDSNDGKYRIGFSECVGGKWRDKVNKEMISAQHLYNNVVDVEIKNADANTERQKKQIDSLVASGIDMLVVAPNEFKAITPSVIKARKQGIPVILFDRKVDTNDYTAYIGGDNVAAGSAMGHYALSLLRERDYDHTPRILEITGGTFSSPAIDRHKGFSSVMRKAKGIEYYYVNTDWTTESAYKAMVKYLKEHPTPDIVFCHSDLSTFYARKAAVESGVDSKIRFLGIDGLPGKDQGIEAVEKGILAGTYIYPTHGEQIVRLALDILQKRPYKRENIMPSVIVTPDNAPIIRQSSEEMQERSHDLLILQNKLENLFGQYNLQRTFDHRQCHSNRFPHHRTHTNMENRDNRTTYQPQGETAQRRTDSLLHQRTPPAAHTTDAHRRAADRTCRQQRLERPRPLAGEHSATQRQATVNNRV